MKKKIKQPSKELTKLIERAREVDNAIRKRIKKNKNKILTTNKALNILADEIWKNHVDGEDCGIDNPVIIAFLLGLIGSFSTCSCLLINSNKETKKTSKKE